MSGVSEDPGGLEAHWGWMAAMDAGQLVFIAACALVAAAAARTLYCLLGRLLGFYSPEHFHAFPKVPWRWPYTLYAAVRRWQERTFVHGRRGATGGFASAIATMTLIFRSRKVFLGRLYAFGLPWFQPIGISPKRHLMALAMTGSGKTVLAVTMLALWIGSAFLIDPKAQIVKALFGRDGRLWFIIDPDGQSGLPSARFNPFDFIKECQRRGGIGAAVLAAQRIAEALIVIPPGNRSPFFYTAPKAYLAGVILHVLTCHPSDQHNLPYVRDLLIHGYVIVYQDGQQMQEGDPHVLLMRMVLANPAFDRVIAGSAAAMASPSGETLGSLRATLLDETKWLDLPNVRRILMRSDFSLADLKRRDDIVVAFTPSIYSVREELSRFARLLTNLTAYTFEMETERKGPCLMVVDELPAQGYNPVFEPLLAVSRSHGLIFFGIAQNVELMKRNYADMYKSFIGEADATWWMGGTHPDNRQLLSELLGKKTLIETDLQTGRKIYRDVAVMEPEQVSRFLDPNSDHMIVTRAGGRPLKLANEPYFKALPFWRYNPDPDHKEPFLRRLMRRLFDKGPKNFHPNQMQKGTDDDSTTQ